MPNHDQPNPPTGPQASTTRPTEATDRLEQAAGKIDLSGNPHRATRIGVTLLFLGLGGFTAWAAFAPLDQGVPAPGAIVIESQRKPVQHLSGGIVRKVHVSEAQQVEAGAVLVELDDTQLRADIEAAKVRFYGGLALEARLQAESDRSSRILFPSELGAAAEEDPQARRNMALQQQLFFRRRISLQA